MTIKQCPHCGGTTGYYITDTIRRGLLYTFNGEGLGATDGYNLYSGKIKRCIDCRKKIGKVEEA